MFQCWDFYDEVWAQEGWPSRQDLVTLTEIVYGQTQHGKACQIEDKLKSRQFL